MLSAGASSSSSSSFPLDKYEVFLSFRGSDTREGFTSHLHAALKQKKIKTFIDDKFERGDQISSTLLKAIDESKISVIVFSKNYASSSWCLEELVHIHHCKEKAGQIVVPAFYHVDPSDVRKQHGVFLAAFAELEKRFKDKMYKVQEWRLAMTAIANLSGWDSSVTRPEAQLVEKIVEDILEKLKRRSCGVDLKGLFGIEKRIKSTELLLRIDVHDVRIIGIWGMGGIGKTTLANVVFIKLSSQFESCCFLENVRERWKKGQKKYHLQNKIYRVLLEEENLNKYTQLIRSNYVQDRLRRKRMLLVLDNVDDQEQLDFLIDHDLFGPGSRIIITTRDVQLLKNLATDMYKVERLNPDEALQLFHFHAFKRSSLTRDPYTKLSGRAVNCAAGNPLALKVLGSHFGNKNKEKWERALNELQKFPYNEQVHNVLMTSYDGLDEGQKNMFLDITCFFKGKARDYVERILSCCDISGDTEIDDLIDKSLITITNDNKIEMHDMVQEMGWEIIRQECKNKPGKRSRLGYLIICSRNETMLSAGASSFSSVLLDKYEVFLSFRGSDTRDNFTSHLHAALSRKKIKTFIDDKFERGDQISSTLLKAIDESKISVIIFSKNYASSSWCLEELVRIHQCMEKAGQIVVPVFYHVDPSDVRKQHGVFAAAFAELEERFEDMMDKVQEWRLAMTAIANLSGWDSSVTRPEAQLVEKIVEDILEKLKRISCGVDLKGLFGIEKRIKSTELLLRIDVHDVHIIGIWGMGGIRKTTLANVVFIKLSSQFESCCFLNVREKWDKGRKKNHLQNEIFQALLEEENLNKDIQLVRSDYVQDRLRRKRMLLVLDNVDDQEQLDFLIDHDLFGPRSRIIITTRDVQLLNNLATDIYKVERLNPDEALQLFHFHAFKRSSLTRDPYTKLSGRAVNCAAGNPLALKVLGSHFGNKNKEKWERALNELQKFPYNEQVQNVLMTSYDGLDEGQKNMFLDIACFFKGKARHYVERILSCCDISGDTEIDDLIDKSLITITNDNKIEMHDMATAAIQGICLDVSDIGDVHLSPYVFEKMDNLRLLWIFYSKITKKGKVCFGEDLQSLPGNLKYLCWDEYPFKSLPTDFTAENLVELCMPHTQLERLWSGVQCVENLKKIDLSYSKRLIEVPDLSRARKLETIYLEECESLCQVPSYFENLDQLRTLFLAGCSSLSEFPQVPKNIRCLVLCRTAIARVPPSIESLSYLEILCLRYCTLEELPNISKPKRLKHIALEGTVLKPKRLNDLLLKVAALRRDKLNELYRLSCFESEEKVLFKKIELEEIELERTLQTLITDWIDEVVLNPYPRTWERKIWPDYTFGLRLRSDQILSWKE
ncbi:hypothetical protein UlMin_010724 [Ulmus minor]